MVESIPKTGASMRIALTGPESTGKTTLAVLLAEYLGATCIPEFARSYLLERQGIYDQSDLLAIAKGQLNLWVQNEKAPRLVSDTEMIVLKIWSEFKYGEVDPFILDALSNQRFDHYFLCYPDIAWEEDPLREHPEQRMELFALYLKELQERRLPFTVVKGETFTRLNDCLRLLKSRN